MPNDLRLISPVRSYDKITDQDCFRIPVTILKISENSITRNIYGNPKGTKCRDVEVEMCSGNGSLVKQDAMMWETTFQEHFHQGLLKLPYSTMAIFRRTFKDDGFEIIIYALDATSVLAKFFMSEYDNEFDRTQKFVENYGEFYDWISEFSK